MAQTMPDRRLGPFPSLSAFVGAIGLGGPWWLSSAPKRGVVGVVQSAKLYSKKNTATGVWRVCTGWVTDSGMHGSGVSPGLPAPVPVTLGVWPDPCLSLPATWLIHHSLNKMSQIDGDSVHPKRRPNDS